MRRFIIRAFFCVVFSCVAVYGYGEQAHGAVRECPVDSVSADSVATDSIGQISLGEVVVKSDLTRRVGNKDIITVTKAMREGTRFTGEVLGKVPGIFYNPVTKEMQVQGSKNILLLVDGVEKGADYIKELRPERFDRIEITYSPSGMYYGYDAVIDLHTRDLYVGYEGGVLNEESIIPGSGTGKGNFLRMSRSGGTYTITREKINFYIDFDHIYLHEGLSKCFSQEYPLNGIKETILDTPYKHPNRTNRSNAIVATAALDFDINERHSVSAKVEVTPRWYHQDCDYTIKRTNTLLGITDTIKQYDSLHESDNLRILTGLWYRGKIDSWKLNANATYTTNGYDLCHQIIRSTGYELNDDRRFIAKYFSAGVDAERSFGDGAWLLSVSDNMTYTNFREKRLHTDNTLSRSHDLRNTFNASLQFQGSREISAGINAGFSILNNSSEGVSRKRLSPKAGVNVLWTPTDKFMMRFNYDMTMWYPTLTTIINYGQFTDSLMYTQGNPRLKTTLKQSWSLSATLFNALTLSTRFVHLSNTIFNYYFPEKGIIPSGADTYYTLNTYVNGKQTDWSLNLSYDKSFGSHWSVNVTASVRGIDARYRSTSRSRIFPDYSWFVNYRTMKGTLNFYLSGYTNPSYEFSPQNDYRVFHDYNELVVDKTFFNKKLELLAGWMIPLHFLNGRTRGGVTSESYVTRYWENNQSRLNNAFRLCIVYYFSGGKSVRKYNRESSSVAI